MSNSVNDRLLDRAGEMVSYWSGTLHAELIEKALEVNDLELLYEAVTKAESAMFEKEYQPDFKPLTDDQIASLATKAWSKGESTDVA